MQVATREMAFYCDCIEKLIMLVAMTMPARTGLHFPCADAPMLWNN